MIRVERLELCMDVPIVGGTPTRARGEIVKLLRPVLGPLFMCIAVVGGWFVYSHLLAAASPQMARPVPVPAAQTPLPAPTPAPVSVPPIGSAAAQVDEQRQEQAERVHEAQHAADVLAKRKAAAWAAYYKAPASCENPPTWADQVERGNQYMRAKKDFEKKWQADLVAENASGRSGQAVAIAH